MLPPGKLTRQIGHHCSHEQYAPGELLDLARAADVAGFDAAMCSDHFAPWTEAQDRDAMHAIVDAFRRGGGEGKPMFLQAVISYAQDDETALDAAQRAFIETFGREVLPAVAR